MYEFIIIYYNYIVTIIIVHSFLFKINLKRYNGTCEFWLALNALYTQSPVAKEKIL